MTPEEAEQVCCSPAALGIAMTERAVDTLGTERAAVGRTAVVAEAEIGMASSRGMATERPRRGTEDKAAFQPWRVEVARCCRSRREKSVDVRSQLSGDPAVVAVHSKSTRGSRRWEFVGSNKTGIKWKTKVMKIEGDAYRSRTAWIGLILLLARLWQKANVSACGSGRVRVVTATEGDPSSDKPKPTTRQDSWQ